MSSLRGCPLFPCTPTVTPTFSAKASSPTPTYNFCLFSSLWNLFFFVLLVLQFSVQSLSRSVQVALLFFLPHTTSEHNNAHSERSTQRYHHHVTRRRHRTRRDVWQRYSFHGEGVTKDARHAHVAIWPQVQKRVGGSKRWRAFSGRLSSSVSFHHFATAAAQKKNSSRHREALP